VRFQPYLDQLPLWPSSGRHILAQFDADSIYVYQAYRPAIARYAVEHQRFGGEFKFTRMSWIKPNFLWMMYRAGWATKEGQEHILAVRLREAVPSGFLAPRYATREDWQAAAAESHVRLQWDPDHHPSGAPLERRAIQLGLRGPALRRYGMEELLAIEDVTPFVAEQRAHVTGGQLSQLLIPEERVYHPADPAAATNVGLESGAR